MTPINLASRIRAHSTATCAFVNSIGAEFGWGSAAGRCAEGQVNCDRLIATWLEDDAPPGEVDRTEPEATAIAKRMYAMEHTRGGRLGPMPVEVRATVLAYLAERIELFKQAEPLLRHRVGFVRRIVKRQIRRAARLEELLQAAWSAS